MMQGSMCNSMHTIGLLDYAYLALNVYQSPKDDSLLGLRPQKVSSIPVFISAMGKNPGWIQLDFPQLKMSHDWTFYAEFYAKVYHGKIQHFMLSFRGTDKLHDDAEDALHWWNTVLPSGNIVKTAIPGYWNYALDYIMKCNWVIKALDQHDLITHFCGQHVTGHSLGGALANLVAAKGAICQPAHIKCRLPVMPDIISFNAPGISGMRHVDTSGFPQGQVVSMRAEYDMVSALGLPYGYVINNIIPEGNEKAKEAFAIQQRLENPTTLQQIFCDKNSPCKDVKRALEAYKAGAIFQQHSMDNFMRVIAQHPGSLTLDFESLRTWAQKHGGKNQDHLAAPLYGLTATKAAA